MQGSVAGFRGNVLLAAVTAADGEPLARICDESYGS